MFRSASRSLLRSPSACAPRHIRLSQVQGRRFISTAPPSQKSRSWKSTVVRWGLAVGAVYYYNTSTVFAEEPTLALQQVSRRGEDDSSSLPTLETVAEAKKRRIASAESKKKQAPPQQPEQPAESADAVAAADVEVAPAESQPLELSPEGLEEEAGQEGAFNPETGEINWDCPCLGGMAHGPCGEEFKAAFSCFVYSTEEPKGIDCIEKFKGMQDCFRLHPEIYGNELEDEEEVDRQVDEQIAAEKAGEKGAGSAPEDKSAQSHIDNVPSPSGATGAVQEDQESDLLVPKVWHDTRDINKEAAMTSSKPEK